MGKFLVLFLFSASLFAMEEEGISTEGSVNMQQNDQDELTDDRDDLIKYTRQYRLCLGEEAEHLLSIKKEHPGLYQFLSDQLIVVNKKTKLPEEQEQTIHNFYSQIIQTIDLYEVVQDLASEREQKDEELKKANDELFEKKGELSEKKKLEKRSLSFYKRKKK